MPVGSGLTIGASRRIVDTMTDRRPAACRTAGLAADFLEGLPAGRSRARSTYDELLARRWAARCRRAARRPAKSSRSSRAAADPGLVATAGPRYFGFVIGGEPLGGARRGLAGHGLGPERRPLRRCRRRRPVVEEVAARWLSSCSACRRRERRLHDRRDDGELHGLAAARHARPGRVGLGRRGGRARRGAADRRRRR